MERLGLVWNVKRPAKARPAILPENVGNYPEPHEMGGAPVLLADRAGAAALMDHKS